MDCNGDDKHFEVLLVDHNFGDGKKAISLSLMFLALINGLPISYPGFPDRDIMNKFS